jgi:hypothetical protein
MSYSKVEYIIDNPFLILALIISIFILFIIRRKLYVEKEEYLSDTNKPSTEFNQQQKLMHKQLVFFGKN